MSKIGLVLEGGGMRGIYTAGVLDYLLEKEIYFDYVVGVSAGAGNAVNYLSRQIGRTKKVVMQEDATRYYGAKQFLENKKLLNLDVLVEEYAEKDIPFDFDTFFASTTEYEIVVTNCETGKAEYKSNYKDKEEFFKCNKATCAVPFLCEPIEMEGNHYLDGSLVDSIPVKRALEKGCDKIIVVLTKPEDSSPTDYAKMKLVMDLCYRKYPALRKVMVKRKKVYEQQEKYLQKLVEKSQAYVIRPDKLLIRHLENNSEKLEQCYQRGYEMMNDQYDAFRRFMER